MAESAKPLFTPNRDTTAAVQTVGFTISEPNATSSHSPSQLGRFAPDTLRRAIAAQ